MSSASTPFVFYTERRLIVLTGRKASNLEDFLYHLKQVSGSCVFYHTHVAYLTRHFEKPRFYDEFANWVSHALQEENLAERMAAIDLLAVTSIRKLRESLTLAIQQHLETEGKNRRECQPGDEFHFCESKSFIMPTRQVAHNIPEFFQTIEKVSNACVHFHFFEARLRLERPTNDFSRWLGDMGEDELAHEIDRLNPYPLTLDELKHEIVIAGRKYLRH